MHLKKYVNFICQVIFKVYATLFKIHNKNNRNEFEKSFFICFQN